MERNGEKCFVSTFHGGIQPIIGHLSKVSFGVQKQDARVRWLETLTFDT